jgi:hypothetical protein
MRSSFLNELHRIENEVNEQFLSFKNDLELRQPKALEVAHVKLVRFRIFLIQIKYIISVSDHQIVK